MADTILENRHTINIVVTTYDMAAKKEDNKFLRKLRPDVSLSYHWLQNISTNRSRSVSTMRVIT